jgi:hypothetical protein
LIIPVVPVVVPPLELDVPVVVVCARAAVDNTRAAMPAKIFLNIVSSQNRDFIFYLRVKTQRLNYWFIVENPSQTRFV